MIRQKVTFCSVTKVKSTQPHAVSLAGQSERTENQTLRFLQTSFTSSIFIDIFIYAPRESSWFLSHLPPVFLILCFRRSTEPSPYLSYRSLFFHKSFFAILSSLIRSTCINQLSTFFFIFTVIFSLVPSELGKMYLWMRRDYSVPFTNRAKSFKKTSQQISLYLLNIMYKANIYLIPCFTCIFFAPRPFSLTFHFLLVFI